MSQSHDPLRSTIKRVRFLGSAKTGTASFIAERLTALALVPLSLWFLVGLLSHITGAEAGLDAAREWMQSPLSLTVMLLFIGMCFWHSRLGMQVIIEDYVSGAFWRNLLLITNLVAHWGLGIFALICVVQLHLTPALSL